MYRLNTINFWTFIGVAGLVFFIFIVILLHFISAELNPMHHFLSEYATSEFGWLFNIALVGNFISLISLGVIIYQVYQPPFRSWTCIVGIWITAITTTIIANIFPADPLGKSITTSGYIHNYSALVGTLSMFVSMIIFSTKLKFHGLLRGRYYVLLILAILAPITFIVLLYINDAIKEWAGLVQRIFSIVMITWTIIAFYSIRTGSITPGKTK